jgi:NADPH:quinone reductase-like Zn-dependent oxidoreductase
MVKSLGAHKVIDYTQQDFTRNGEKWDIIFDNVVGKTSFTRCKRSLTPNGFYLSVAGGLKDMLQMIRTSFGSGRKVVWGGGTNCEKKENLLYLKDLIEKGELKTIIDKSFPLEQTADAHRYVESGKKRGNVVVVVG